MLYVYLIVRCLLLAIYYDKLYCKANGLLAFLQVELLKIGYFVRYLANVLFL